MSAYYNEIDPYAAQWLRNLIDKGLIADGEVDTRSIIDVQPDDLKGFTQCHFFAGIAGWSHALRLAGWSDDKEIWTGSCPCQPFSVAGKGKGKDDERHLWPHFFRLISACRPTVVMGEQVAGSTGYDWLDGVRSDLEGEDYSCEGVDIPACSVNAPHIRQRLYWCAVDDTVLRRYGDEDEKIFSGRDCAFNASGDGNDVADTESGTGRNVCENEWAFRGEVNSLDDASGVVGRFDRSSNEQFNSFWHNAEYISGADGKTRRVKPGVRLLVNGVSSRVGRLRAYGNAIVPQVAAEVIKAFIESQG